MNTEQKQSTDSDSAARPRQSQTNEQIQTPPPPQVIDPSKAPGEGTYETYERGESKQQSKPDEAQAKTV